MPRDDERRLREEISQLVKKIYCLRISQKESSSKPIEVPYGGRVYDEKEIMSLVDASLDFWLTSGRYANQFESEFSNFLGVRYCVLTNSGSSANLLAISALTSAKLEEKRLQEGDEIITLACAFPTTINPIIQNRLVPVFLDVDLETANIRVDDIENAITEKTKAIFIAHTLGNPFNLEAISRIAKKYGLWLVEDACDALGSRYNDRYVGTFGELGTFSFYPAHHITMGEGGAVVTNDKHLKQLIESFRDWGRDCWCAPGRDDTCGRRFSWQLGTLPSGYDHKYVYSHIGYNMKVTDMQAAIGCEQLKKLPDFIETRKKNWMTIRQGLDKYNNFFVFHKSDIKADPSWFGFLLTVKQDSPFSKNDLVDYLERHKISTRPLFAGNILKHPAYQNISCRVIGALRNSDYLMVNSFWIGVYPGLDQVKLKYIIDIFESYMKKFI